MNELNLLIVDDHLLIRKGVRLLIEKSDLIDTIFEADNGTDAIRMVEMNAIDVVILDLSMPDGLDGFTAAKNMLQTNPTIKIIVLTMHDEEVYIQKAIQSNIHGYLLKNSEENEMIEAIQAVTSGKFFYRTRLTDEQLLKLKKDHSATSILTPREQEVLRLVSLGYSNMKIGSQLLISTKTVERHKANMMQKLQLKESHELIQYGIRNNYIDLV